MEGCLSNRPLTALSGNNYCYTALNCTFVVLQLNLKFEVEVLCNTLSLEMKVGVELMDKKIKSHNYYYFNVTW